VYRDATVGFYQQTSREPTSPPLGSRDFLFWVGVYSDVLAGWERVAIDPFDGSEDQGWPPPMSVADPIDGRWRVYHHGAMRDADPAQAENLEPAAVWDLEHVVSRLLAELPHP